MDIWRILVGYWNWFEVDRVRNITWGDMFDD